MQLETPRLLLRPLHAEDASQVYAYSREPSVGPAAGWKPHESVEETRRILAEQFLGQENLFAMILRGEMRLIGTIGLLPDVRRDNPRTAMLGYAMSEACWGRGLMTEAAAAVLHKAFADGKIDLVSAYCYPFNHRSERVLEKCGFRYEGCLRAAEKRYDGCVLDCRCYSLRREELLL